MASNLELIKEELKRNQETGDSLKEALASLYDSPDEEEQKEDSKRKEKEAYKKVNDEITNTTKAVSKIQNIKDGFMDLFMQNAGMALGIAGLNLLLNNANKIDEFVAATGEWLDGPIQKTSDFITTWNEKGGWAALDELIGEEGELKNLLSEIGLLLVGLKALSTLGALDSYLKSRKPPRVRSSGPSRRGGSRGTRARRLAQLRRERARQQRLRDQARARQAELEARRARDARANASLDEARQISRNKTIKTDIGDLSYNENTKRFQKVTPKGWGTMVKNDDALKAIQRTAPSLSPAPTIDAPVNVVDDVAQRVSREAVTETAERATREVGEEASQKIARSVAKRIGGGLIKSIPIIGDLLGLGFAGWSAWKGDFVTAGLEAGGIIPIAGIPSDVASIPTGVYFDVYGEQFTGSEGQVEKMQLIMEEVERQLDELSKSSDTTESRISAEDQAMAVPVPQTMSGLSQVAAAIPKEETERIQKLLDRNDLLRKINDNVELTEEEEKYYNELMADGLLEVFAPSMGIAVVNNSRTSTTQVQPAMVGD